MSRAVGSEGARRLDDAAVERLRRVAAGAELPGDSTGPTAAAPDLTGTRYEMVETIGRGGMGAVYRVRDGDLGRDLALKVLAPEQSGPDAARRMLEEARILARLEHPGIVPVHDVGTLPDGRLFYTMRLVRGSRLDELVERGATREDRLRAFERLCEAVAFAHAHGVIHRDLKPENVMVGAFGEVLVMDWGVAKVRRASDDAMERPTGGGMDREEARPSIVPNRAESGAPSTVPSRAVATPRDRVTEPGAVLGTPGYMAPEQARGDAARADERSDVHALGAILRFLLTGRHPDETAEVRVAGGGSVVAPAVPSPREDGPRPAGPDAAPPAALEAVCRKALAADPADRYAGAAEMRDEVRRWLSGLPVLAHPEGPLERVRRVAARHRTAILLVLAYLVMRLLLGLLAGV